MNFHDDGVFCVELTSFTGQMRQAARANGFSWLAAVLAHNPAAGRNTNDITLNASVYRREGWHVCGWATFGQADTPENDAASAASLCRHLSLDGWVANGEAWAEGAHRDYSLRFMTAWKQQGAPVPLAVSCLSSDTDQFARDFDYRTWLDSGSVIMPQVYGNEHATYTVGACLGMLDRAGVPQTSLNLTFGTYAVNGQWNVPYTDYQGWSGPRSVYLGESTPANGWPLLGRASARPDTPPNVTEWWEKPYPRAEQPAYDGELPFPLYPPDSAPGKTPSKDSPLVVAVKRAVSRAGRWPWQQFDQTYSNGFSHGTSGMVGKTGVAGVQRQQGIQATGWVGKATFDALNWGLVPDGLPHAGEPLFDSVAVDLIRKSLPSVPNLGPVRSGGVSVLDQDLTHATGGIPLFPAFDDCFGENVATIAPEDMTVDTRATSSNPGHAFYATGKSGLRYWVGHLNEQWPLGHIFRKGERVGTTCHNTVGGGPHAHWGVNAESYLGPGRELEHHTDYTHGAATVGEQLADALL